MTEASEFEDLDVVVVDDDFRVARIHGSFVERSDGFRLAGTASTGAEALELVERLRPDLLLLDVHLPDMTGLDVLRRLRAAGSEVGVVMVTAERDAEAVRSALHGGALQYVVKPFEYVDLEARLQQVRAVLLALDADAPSQADIDLAFGRAAGSGQVATTLPKGLSPETAALVAEALEQAGELSASSCAERVGLSRVTARRYLEHFVSSGRAVVRLEYGAAGRPERHYRRS